jgi:hypothetical protein
MCTVSIGTEFTMSTFSSDYSSLGDVYESIEEREYYKCKVH